MMDAESKSDVRFGVEPISDVPKIEHRRFSAFPCNTKPVLTELLEIKTRNQNSKSKLEIENRNSKSKLEIETPKGWSRHFQF